MSIFTVFEMGWHKGFQKSEKNCHEREKLILDAIRPLVSNLDEIIVKAITKKD